MATKIDLAVSMVLDSKGVVVGFRDVKNKVRDLEGQFMKLNDTLKEVKRGSEGFQAAASTAMETYQKQTRTAGTATSNFKSKLDDLFKPVTTLNQAFGLLQQSLYVVQRAFQLTVGSAIDLELQVARINTVLDESERGQVDFAKQILQMQATFGANPTEAAKGFYEAIASGATNAAGSIELMATAQKLAIGGLLPLDKALSGLTAVMASYGYTAEQTKFISDGFFIAAAKGKTNVEELTQEIGNVSSIAQQSGVSFAELVSSISAVTLGGKRTAEATTSVRSAINALLTPTEQLQYVFDQLNIKSVTQEIRQRGLAAVYKDIYKYVNNNAEALSKLVGRVEAISAVVALTTGKQADAYKLMVDEINNGNRQMGDRTDEAFKMIEKTSSESLKRAKESISASFTDISQIAMKIVVPAMTAIAAGIRAILQPIIFVTDQMESFANSLDSRVVPTVLAATAAIAGIVTVVKMGFAPAMIALGGALKIAVVPLLAISAKIVAVGTAITLVLAAVDSFIRNWELIPVVFEYLIAKFDEVKLRFLASLNDLLVKLVQKGQEFTQKFPQLSEFIGLKFLPESAKKQGDQLGKELDLVVERAQEAKKKIVSTFDAGAFGALKDIGKSIFGGGKEQIFGPPKPPQTGAPALPSVDAQVAPDVGKAIEERNRLQEQLNTMLGSTAKYEEEIRMSQVYGNDAAAEALRIEFEKIDTLAAQLDAHKALTKEQLIGIDKFKETAAQAIEIRINTQNLKEAAGWIDTAASGANALVQKAMPELAKMAAVAMGLPPEVGGMVGSMINFLRQGKEFTSNFAKEITKIIIELPLMVANGVEGIWEGTIDGLINMLADPARLAKILTSLATLIPKIITVIAKAIPKLLKMLLDPKFWKELISQIVRTMFDAIIEMFVGIGDLIASIFTGDIFKPDEEKAENFGTTAAESFNSSIQMSTGYGEQLFGVQNEQIQTALQGVEQTAQKINKAFADGVKKQESWWDRLKTWFDKNWIGVVLAPFTMGLSLLFDNEKWKKFGVWLDENIFQPVIKFFEERWLGMVLAPFTLGLSLLFDNEQIKKGAEKLWKGIKDEFANAGDWLAKLFTIPDSAYGKPGPVEEFLGWNLPWMTFAEGGKVPGKASVFGDSIKNDTVPALLSPGEVVIPRSIMNDPASAKLIYSLMQGQDVGMHASGFFGNVAAVLTGEKSVSDALSDAGTAIKEGFKQVGDFFMPEWLVEIYESAKNFLSGIDLKKLIQDPVGTLKDAIKGMSSFLSDMLKKIFSINVKGFATGGLVPGSGFTDSVPAMLTPGEFVINRNAAQALGGGLLNQLNNGRMPTQESAPIFNINLNIETKDALDATFIRNTLLPTIKNELKASSLRGDFVLSAKGVRK